MRRIDISDLAFASLPLKAFCRVAKLRWSSYRRAGAIYIGTDLIKNSRRTRKLMRWAEKLKKKHQREVPTSWKFFIAQGSPTQYTYYGTPPKEQQCDQTS